MQRYKLTIEYDGTDLLGWQRQEEGPTVQEHLETAIYQFCQEEVEVYASGRTDAGVHAFGQVAHVDIEKETTPFTLMQAVNFHLMPHKIAIVQAEPVSPEFHARFDAKRRHYLYRIINRRARVALDEGRAWHVPEPLDADVMHEAAQILVGHHDFSSFRDAECQAKSPLKTMERLDVERQRDEIQLYATSKSFLHHQIRIIAGTLVYAGKGKWQPEYLSDILMVKDRRVAGPTAPAYGLYFMKVDY